MRRLQLERDPSVDPLALRFTKARDDQFDRLIEEPALLFEGDRLLGAVLAATVEPRLISALKRMPYNSQGFRTAGISSSNSVTFGFLPRVAVRANYCRIAASARTHGPELSILFEWGRRASEALREINPSQHADQATRIQSVLPEWQMPGTVFTSGIANRTKEIPYHFDSGNFKGSWNCMYAFSSDTRGGHLVLPEYRVAISVQEPRLAIFDAQSILHGVSHIVPRSRSAYRFSLVYYALEAMKNCLCIGDEIRRVKQWQTKSAQNWAAGSTDLREPKKR